MPNNSTPPDDGQRLTAPPTLNPKEAIAHLRFLDATGRHQLAAIHPETEVITVRSFRSVHLDERRVIEFITTFGVDHNLYYALNEPRADLGDRRTRKEDIANIRAIAIDLDPDKDEWARPGGPDRESARLEDVSLASFEDEHHPPSFGVNSGGGFQLGWLLDQKLPAIDHTLAAENQTRGIARAFRADESTTDISRLLRLPGTINFPNKTKRRSGRTTSQASAIKYIDAATTNLSRLSTFHPPAESRSSRRSKSLAPEIDSEALNTVASLGDLPGAVASKLRDLRTEPAIERLWNGERAAAPGDDASGSGYAFALACLVRPTNKITPTEFGMLLRVWDFSSDPDKIDARYVARAWAKAKASAEEELGPYSDPNKSLDTAAPGAMQARDLAPPASEWDSPQNLWVQEQWPAPLPPALAPAFVERFANDKAEKIGVDAGAIAAAAITSLSSLIDARTILHGFRNNDDWPVRCILWTAIVGDPGTAKSPAVKAAMAFPKVVEATWRAQYAHERDEYDKHLPIEQPRKSKRPPRTAISTRELNK